MKTRHKYHLFPEQEVTYTWKGKECKIMGIRKTPDLQYDKKSNDWIRLEQKPDSEGNFRWSEPDLIAIVKAQKSFCCDSCKRQFSPVKTHWYPSKIIKPVWYVGLPDLEGCCVPEWGYTTKFCLECASRIFKDAVVYKCDGWDMPGRSKEAPKINEPPIKLAEEIQKFLNIMESK